MEDGFYVRSDNWADGMCERDFVGGQAWWDEDRVVSEPESVTTSTHGNSGDVEACVVLERDGTGASLVPMMSE